MPHLDKEWLKIDRQNIFNIIIYIQSIMIKVFTLVCMYRLCRGLGLSRTASVV
jgi:hypothetical protein